MKWIANIQNELIVIKFYAFDRDTVDKIKTRIGRRWKPERKEWVLPVNADNLKFVANELVNGEISNEINDLVAELEDDSEISNNMIEFKTKPYAHQKEAFDLCLQNEFFALFMEMGTGKTKVIIDVADYYFANNIITQHLIVCPNSIAQVWYDQYAEHSSLGLKPALLVGKKEDRIARILTSKVHCINFEGLRVILDDLIPFYKLKEFRMMITIDESSKIKNPQALQTKNCLKLSNLANHRYILSGTPITQNYLDLFSQFKFLSPQIWDQNSFYGFRNHYCEMGGWQGKEVLRFRNVDEIDEKIKPYYYRVLKKDCLDLPDKIYQERYVFLSKDERKFYEDMYQKLVIEIEQEGGISTSSVQNVMNKSFRLQQITAGFITLDDGSIFEISGSSKLKELKTLIEEICIDNSSKMAIQVKFIREGEIIKKMIDEMRIPCILLNGSVNQETRSELIKQFQESNHPMVAICGVDVTDMGITLTAAKYIVKYTNTYSYQQSIQFEDRFHRIGSDEPVTYIDLMAKNTIDEVIQKILARKWKMADYLIKQGVNGLHRFLGERNG